MSKECGAGGRTRTDMSVTSLDFESSAYTNFATPAHGADIIRFLVSAAQPDFIVTTDRP